VLENHRQLTGQSDFPDGLYVLSCKDRSKGRRYESRFSRAAAGQPGAHTNGPKTRAFDN